MLGLAGGLGLLASTSLLAAPAADYDLSQPISPQAAARRAVGQVPAMLASNLRGDQLLLLADPVDPPGRHQQGQQLAALAFTYSQATTELNLPEARRRVDLTEIDCNARTWTLWRSDVYLNERDDAVPAASQTFKPEQRQAQPWTSGGSSAALRAGAMRRLCGSDVRDSATGQPTLSALSKPQPAPENRPSSPTPDHSAGPTAASEVLSGPATGPSNTPTAPSPVGRIDGPVFTGSAFSLRTLARLADAAYTDEGDWHREQAVRRVLEAAQTDFQVRPTPDRNLKATLVQMALEQTRREETRLSLRVENKRDWINEAGLRSVGLPSSSRPSPKSFHAELYQHVASGQYLLVLRGGTGAEDWLSLAWTGLDAQAALSPPFAALDEMLQVLRRLGIAPLLVGHSLGAAMAEYGAVKYGLRVVGFNPVPLPARYLPDMSRYDTANARLFSAVEMPAPGTPAQSSQDLRTGDIVSLRLSAQPGLSNGLGQWLQHGRHLVLPVCLLTQPEPYMDAYEDAATVRIIGANFTGGPLKTILYTRSKDILKKQLENAGVEAYLSQALLDRAWTRAAGSDAELAQEAQRRALEAGLGFYKSARSFGKTVGTAWDIATGQNSLKAAGKIGAGLFDMVAMMRLERMIQVHGMERFARGLGAEGDDAPFGVNAEGQPACAEVLAGP